MVRGIYSAAAGMITQYKKIDVLGNNISNVNTTGFKQSDISFSDFGQELAVCSDDGKQIGSMPLCVVLGQESNDLTPGALKSTAINTDLAIDGTGFFAVRTPNSADTKYTRAGDFIVDPQGCLSLPNGEQLLSQNGTPLYVGDNNFKVNTDGTVTLSNGTTNKIDMYTSANVTKRKDGFFNLPGAAAVPPANGQIKQGWIEDSNTDVIKNMTEMMAATRSFQGSQQAFQISSEALDKLVSSIGSIK
jgi:flagellar basal-body rod protein FlgF